MAARIALAGVDQLSRVEPLTRALHEHHRAIDPAIPGVPLRDTDAWWSVRRDRYRAWLAEPDTFLLVADDEDGTAAGYALVTFHDRDDSNATGDRFAELQSLVVSPERRGGGLGTELLHEVYREVRRRGAEEMVDRGPGDERGRTPTLRARGVPPVGAAHPREGARPRPPR